jgi:hypothetical protein
MSFMFYLIAKMMLFLISETNSYPPIIVKKHIQKMGEMSYSIIDKCSNFFKRKSVSYCNIAYSVHYKF